ncbi:dihydrolipoamide acetyltransferase family protein [Photobacterium lucens]|uniref:dihydrolipoamide acetyltransferase family protein n=1 Tax=Photobacterium lucens TaxID=2562949 RepID=UPI00136CB3FE|nr:dihydrolipoamide acetyltransferase family protein [Photobacterium lucens]MBP2701920.1 2-oxo acid dehydrogenase subunit E2 [Vibrio parahaemolyticus]MZG57302.1 2-oxo acid dehydrogenase subunit E2 [Photobacterium lucens]MZG81923.1 2-oxo acid dehydrogenase subunit E2 [Photobacterium lucens]
MKAFTLPDLGEGLAESEIVQWHINIGDTVTTDQVVVTVETAKATVDVPAPYSGKIIHRYGNEGDTINIGQCLLEIDELRTSASSTTIDNVEQESNDNSSATVVGQISQLDKHVDIDHFSYDEVHAIHVNSITNADHPLIATPSARLLAQKLGIKIEDIEGSGTNHLIVDTDIYQAYQQQTPGTELLKGARRNMAKNMAQSHHDVASVTITEEAHLYHWHKNDDITVNLVQAINHACHTEPALNAWFDADTMTRCLHKTVNIGIAVDSAHGLYVPVLHHAEQYHNEGIRRWIDRTAASIRGRKISRHQLQKATITLSNYGAIAGIYATPVVTPPQVAIVGAGRIMDKVVMEGERINTVKVLPLSITFDHRACTGGEAARFIKALVHSLEHLSYDKLE